MSSNHHHRRPRSRGGSRHNGNYVKVDAERHHYWHCLFGNMTGEEIMREINTLWLDPRFKVVPR